jgi:hypothetical protein
MTSEISLNTLKAAYYRACDPRLTQQISETVGLGTQAQVSRLLAEAREHYVLREVFQFPTDLPEDERQQAADSFFAPHRELEDALAHRAEELRTMRAGGGSPFKRLHVAAAPGIENDWNEKVRERALQAFGIRAAEIVTGYIDETMRCCVAWGRLIAATVRSLVSGAPLPGQALRHGRRRGSRYPRCSTATTIGEGHKTLACPVGVAQRPDPARLISPRPGSQGLACPGYRSPHRIRGERGCSAAVGNQGRWQSDLVGSLSARGSRGEDIAAELARRREITRTPAARALEILGPTLGLHGGEHCPPASRTACCAPAREARPRPGRGEIRWITGRILVPVPEVT